MQWGDSWGELWGVAIPEITTHKIDAIDRLIDFFDRDKWQRLIGVVGERAQVLEDTAVNLPWLFDVRTAYGVWLDTIGAILNEPRNAQSDPDYRKLVRVKGEQIRRRHTAEDLLKVARLLVGDPSRTIALTDTYPKAYKLEIQNLTLNEIVLFVPFLSRSRPVTYQGKIIVTVTDAFGHSDASATLPPSPPPHGFGDASAVVAGGGFLSYIVPF